MADYKLASAYTGAEPITLDEAKDYLRVDFSNDNAYITSLISTSREMIEKDTNTAIVNRSYTEYLDGFPADIIYLQVSGEIDGIPSINYMSQDSITHDKTLTLDTDFILGEFRGRPRLQSITTWPTARELIGSVKIRYVIEPQIDIPLPLKQAMYMLISHFYDNRSAVSFLRAEEMPLGYRNIIRQYKNYIV